MFLDGESMEGYTVGFWVKEVRVLKQAGVYAILSKNVISWLTHSSEGRMTAIYLRFVWRFLFSSKWEHWDFATEKTFSEREVYEYRLLCKANGEEEYHEGGKLAKWYYFIFYEEEELFTLRNITDWTAIGYKAFTWTRLFRIHASSYKRENESGTKIMREIESWKIRIV